MSFYSAAIALLLVMDPFGNLPVFISLLGDFDPRRRRRIIVPLAVPLIAGPSTMATVILFSTRYPDRVLEWLGALAIAWGVTFGLLFASGSLAKVLGMRGLKAIERLSGMILTTLAVQMLLSGIAEFMESA